jgi:hypothetical protein
MQLDALSVGTERVRQEGAVGADRAQLHEQLAAAAHGEQVAGLRRLENDRSAVSGAVRAITTWILDQLHP